MPKFKVKVVDTYVGKREAVLTVDAVDAADAAHKAEIACAVQDVDIQWDDYLVDTTLQWQVEEVSEATPDA